MLRWYAPFGSKPPSCQNFYVIFLLTGTQKAYKMNNPSLCYKVDYDDLPF